MKPLTNQKKLRLRMTLMGSIFFLCLGTIIGRAVYLQVVFGPSLAEKASDQYEKTIQTDTDHHRWTRRRGENYREPEIGGVSGL